mgnify:CR=1 FL=1
MSGIALAVIGGTGVYALAALEDVETREVQTRFGTPSGPVLRPRKGPPGGGAEATRIRAAGRQHGGADRRPRTGQAHQTAGGDAFS